MVVALAMTMTPIGTGIMSRRTIIASVLVRVVGSYSFNNRTRLACESAPSVFDFSLWVDFTGQINEVASPKFVKACASLFRELISC